MPRQPDSAGRKSGSRPRGAGKGRTDRTEKTAAQGHGAAHETRDASGGKVGSDPSAVDQVGGKNDFGIPAPQAAPGQQTVLDGSAEELPPGRRIPPATGEGVRVSGVGVPDSGPGGGSGGDLDPDIIGVGTGTGIAASPDRRTTGADIVTPDNVLSAGASGPPAKGEHNLPPGHHGTVDTIEGTVHDRGDREVRMGETGNEATLPHADQADTDTDAGFDRSSGEDVDDREAQTGEGGE